MDATSLSNNCYRKNYHAFRKRTFFSSTKLLALREKRSMITKIQNNLQQNQTKTLSPVSYLITLSKHSLWLVATLVLVSLSRIGTGKAFPPQAC